MKHFYLIILVGLLTFNQAIGQDEHKRGPYLETSFMFAPFYQIAMYNGGLKVGYQHNRALGFGVSLSSYSIIYSLEGGFGEAAAQQLMGVYYRYLQDRWIFTTEVGSLSKGLVNNSQQMVSVNPFYFKQEIGYAISPSFSIGTFFNYIPKVEMTTLSNNGENTKFQSFFHPSLYLAINFNKSSLSRLNNQFSKKIPYQKKKLRHINFLENTEALHLQKFYTDVHFGWFGMGDLNLVDLDMSFGYQHRHTSGLGVGLNYMSANIEDKSCNYTGIGLQYRYINDWIIVKAEVGQVIDQSFGVDNWQPTAEKRYEFIQAKGLNYYLRLNSGFKLGNYLRLGYSLSYLPNLEKEEGFRLRAEDEWEITKTDFKPTFFGLNIGFTLPMKK